MAAGDESFLATLPLSLKPLIGPVVPSQDFEHRGTPMFSLLPLLLPANWLAGEENGKKPADLLSEPREGKRKNTR